MTPTSVRTRWTLPMRTDLYDNFMRARNYNRETTCIRYARTMNSILHLYIPRHVKRLISRDLLNIFCSYTRRAHLRNIFSKACKDVYWFVVNTKPKKWLSSYVDNNNSVIVMYRTYTLDSGDCVIAEPKPRCAMPRCDALECAKRSSGDVRDGLRRCSSHKPFDPGKSRLDRVVLG
jgi:hypothetical protein